MKKLVTIKSLAVVFCSGLLFSGLSAMPTSAEEAIAIGPQSGGVGSEVSVYGEGFEQNTAYDIYFSNQDTIVATARHIGIDITRYKKVTTINTTYFPSFNAVFTVPESLDTATDTQEAITHDGDYFIYITGYEGTLIRAKAVFKMTGFAHVEIDPASGNVGDGVIINGTGYVPGETIRVDYDNKDVTDSHIGGSTIANNSGAFTLTLTVPASVYGPHQVQITGTSTESVLLDYRVLPEIKINKTAAFAGEQISITGSGFAGVRKVDFTFGGDAAVVEWVLQDSGRVDDGGRFVVNMVVPSLPAGEYQVVATDATAAQITTEKSFTVLPPPLNPQLDIDFTLGRVGETVTVNGVDFNKDRPITLAVDGVLIEPESPINTDDEGVFTGIFTIPSLSSGVHAIKASDGTLDAEAAFSVMRVLELSPLNGKSGTVVTVAGNGLDASTPVAVYFDSVLQAITPAGVETGADGSLNFTFTVPPCAPGPHTIQVKIGNLTQVETFTTKAEVSLEADTVCVGKQLVIYARSFAPNSPMVINLNGIKMPAASTDPAGSLNTSFVVPHLPEGTYGLTIEVAGEVLLKSITIVAEASISPAEGPVGTSINLSGFGFWPDKTLVLEWDGKALTVLSPLVVGSNGSFGIIFDVPVAGAGEHTISISDGVINKTLVFNLEQTVPPVPLLVAPETQTKINGQPYFEWEAVSYQYMGVTYDLQIIKNIEEPELVLDKSGLSEASYTLGKNERLENTGKDDPYFWRVRAVDEAGSTSQWSEAREFYCGFVWPGWLTWVLVGLGVLIIVIVVWVFRWRIVDLFY